MARKEETVFATKAILDYLQSNLPPVNWSDEDSPIKGLQADIYGITERSYIFIELEMTREDPLENVGKIVYENNQRSDLDKNIRLIQIFSNFYRETTDHMNRRQQASIMIGDHFAGEMDNFEYHHLNLNTTPARSSDRHLPNTPEPDSDRKEHAEAVAEEIPQLLL